MAGEMNKKRPHEGYKRRHDRKKFKRSTNATVQRKDLGNGLQGILFSCTPNHENHAFREAVIMLGKYCGKDEYKRSKSAQPPAAYEEKAQPKADVPEPQPANKSEDADPKPASDSAPKDISKALEAELNEVRNPSQNLFTRVDGGANGALFIQINDLEVDREKVVEAALEEARASGSPNCRHCIRMLPIHTTCYAKPEEAAKAAAGVVKEYFPAEAKSYAIAFRHRLNTGVHREEYIDAIAKVIEGYRVDLTKPDVTLLVEVVKTSCCIGTFSRYFDLAKMNLREAACPSKPKEAKLKEEAKKKGDEGKGEARNGAAGGKDRRTNTGGAHADRKQNGDKIAGSDDAEVDGKSNVEDKTASASQAAGLDGNAPSNDGEGKANMESGKASGEEGTTNASKEKVM